MGLQDYLKSKSLDKILTATEEKTYLTDKDIFYYPARNEKRAASVDIRFLPQKNPDALPWVLVYNHSFKGDDGRWMINEMCPSTFGKRCPVCEKNRELYATGNEAYKAIASTRGRKKKYICNILVLRDPLQPENEGKVFPFKFGPSIFKMIETSLKPDMEGDPVINPFDLINGATFNLRVVYDKNKDQTSYDTSKFYSKSALYDGNENKLEAVVNQLIDLDARFKNEADLKSDEYFVARAESGYSNTVGKPSNLFPSASQAQAQSAIHTKPLQVEPDFGNSFDTSDSDSVTDLLSEFKSLTEDF